MEARRFLTSYALLAIFIVGAIIARYFILGGLSVTTLKPAPPLAGALAPSLANLSSKGALPVEGKDYVIRSTTYFDNKTYAVVSVSTNQERSDNVGVLVLQNFSGAYKVILGPGTAFSTKDIQDLPNDVSLYLKSKVFIYEPVD